MRLLNTDFGITLIVSERRRKFSYYCFSHHEHQDGRKTVLFEINSFEERDEIYKYFRSLGLKGIRKRSSHPVPKNRLWFTLKDVVNTSWEDCELVYPKLSEEDFGNLVMGLLGLKDLGYLRASFYGEDSMHVLLR